MEGLSKTDRTYAGDFGTPEQQIPASGLPGVDWESCMTMNDTWGFKSYDENWKSSETLIRNLIDIVSKGGNYLLNVGPTAEGEIPAPSVERLGAIGPMADGQWRGDLRDDRKPVHGAAAVGTGDAQAGEAVPARVRLACGWPPGGAGLWRHGQVRRGCSSAAASTLTVETSVHPGFPSPFRRSGPIRSRQSSCSRPRAGK